MKIKTNKLLQDKLEEETRKSKLEEIRNSLTEEDFEYIVYYI